MAIAMALGAGIGTVIVAIAITRIPFGGRVIRARGREVAVITNDTYRIAAVDQLKKYADIIGSFTDDIDRPYIGRLNVEHWSLGMDRALQFREAGAEERFYDIDFRAMQADPVGEVKGLYAWLHEPVSDEFADRMQSWWTHAAAEREPSSHADPAEFGIDLDAVRPRFGRYVSNATRWTAHPSR